MNLKSYFTWAPKLPEKSCYDMEEVFESLEYRKHCTFENHYLNIYYWFCRNFDFIWKPYILKGYIKRAYQRCTRGWSDRDLWSLDYTIAKFALPRVKELKKQKHGTPTIMFEKLPEGEWEYTDEQTKAAEAKWEYTLDEIIFALDYIANNREWLYYPKTKKPERADYGDLMAVEERVQAGLDMFGKYFRCLWD